MIDLEDYIPKPDSRARETTTWSEHHAKEYVPSAPECSAHHTYRRTVPLERFEIWACPGCGRYSDTYVNHSGGTHLTAPTDIDTSRVLVVTGRARVPPSDSGDPFGDGTMDAALVATPYAAREDIKAFKSDVEWRPETGGAVGYRRWVPDWNVWAVRYIALDGFIDHMAARDWIVVNIPDLEEETTAE